MCWRCELIRTTASALSRRPQVPCASARRVQSLVYRPRQLTLPPRSQFHSSAQLLKKGAKKGPSDVTSTGATTADGDVFRLAALRENVSGIVSKLGEDITRLRSTMRVNAETLENLRVTLDKAKKQSIPLRDVAQVVPKGGRSVTIQVLEPEYVKAVTSAITSSSLSVAPVPDPHAPQHLNITLPAVTKEARLEVVDKLKKLGTATTAAVRDAREKTNKNLRQLKLSKQAGPDDIRKAEAEMEKLSKSGVEEVGKLVKQAEKGMLEG